jgi:hypothetical protein
MHDSFPVSLLEPYKGRNGEIVATQDLQPTDEIYYEFEQILGHRGYGKNRQYKIRWKGCTSEEDSWEPRNNILPGAVQSYENEIKTRTRFTKGHDKAVVS